MVGQTLKGKDIPIQYGKLGCNATLTEDYFYNSRRPHGKMSII